MFERGSRNSSREDRELARALVALGRHIEHQATPDIAGQVRARLETHPGSSQVPASKFGPGPRITDIHHRRVRLALAACLLFGLVASLAVLAAARTTIAEFLELSGVEIRWLANEPLPPPTPVGEPLLLGRAVTSAEAQASVEFPLLWPTARGFDATPEIYVSGAQADAMVSFVYPAKPDLPAVDETGAGALLTQFAGRTERSLIEKGLQSGTGDGNLQTDLEPVTVLGEPGFWITGARHAVFFVCSGVGECRQESYRLAGNVLLWEHDGVTLRLESGLPLDAALAVAASTRPAAEVEAGT